MGSSVRGGTCGQQAFINKGRLMTANLIQGLLAYKVLSPYLFNLHNLPGVYYFPYHSNKKTEP